MHHDPATPASNNGHRWVLALDLGSTSNPVYPENRRACAASTTQHTTKPRHLPRPCSSFFRLRSHSLVDIAFDEGGKKMLWHERFFDITHLLAAADCEKFISNPIPHCQAINRTLNTGAGSAP
jgi:hypothetical protein